MSDDTPRDLLPLGLERPADEIARDFTQTEVRPAANPGYAFRLPVPNGWVLDEIEGMDREVNAAQLTPLAGWHADKEGQPVVFHVQAVGLLREVTAAHFIVSHGRAHGLPLEALREVSPYLADAMLLQRIEGEPFALRMVTTFVGDRAFVASGIVHASELDAYNETFGIMVANLEILEQPESPYVERRIRRTILDRVRFDAPVSFRSMTASDGTETHQAIDLMQRSPSGEFTGLIRVDMDLEAVEQTDDQELAYVAAHVMNRGAELGTDIKELETGEGEGALRVRKSMIVDASIPGKSVPQEVWITLLEVNGAALRVWMIGPSRDAFFESWAINQRGYRILLETLHVLA